MAELTAVIVGIYFAQYCKFIPPSSMPVFCAILTTLSSRPVYTRDPHSLFIAPVDDLALSSTRPSACAEASTKLHMFKCCCRRIRNCFEPRWRHLCWVTRCQEISWHFEYKLEMVNRGNWWNVCFVIVWYWIIMTEAFHVLMMACYLTGHSYEDGIAYICYWQTISCLMVICGLWITNISLGVIWDACLIGVRSVYKFIQIHGMKWVFHGTVIDKTCLANLNSFRYRYTGLWMLWEKQ